MRIGICSWWFNRGQAVVGRYLRSAFDRLGHETFVLARPTRGGNIRPSFIDRTGVWDQPGVTEASAYEIPWEEYERWAEANRPEVVFFDQNYQLEEIARLRRMGVKTVGRFVWEAFSPEHVPAALEAFDVIYSMTGCERERYATFGIESPRVCWGCHPELLEITPRREPDTVTFFFPGGFVSKRKPVDAVLEAFSRASDPRLRLLFKAQVDRGVKKVRKRLKRDSRVRGIWEDLPTSEYLQLFADSDVCLAPSRWEGLGLHLYEAIAFGMPIVTNDNPPMNELIEDGVSGILVRGVPDGEAKSGIPAFQPDVGELARAIERVADGELRERLSQGALEMREGLSWDNTVADLASLLERVAPERAAGAPAAKR